MLEQGGTTEHEALLFVEQLCDNVKQGLRSLRDTMKQKLKLYRSCTSEESLLSFLSEKNQE